MKKSIFLGFSAMALATIFGSCADEWGVRQGDGAGCINPMVGIDTELISSRSDAGSRAETEIAAADLSLRLTSADGSYSETWERLGDFPLDKKFKAGNYTVEAFYGDAKEEGFDRAAYYGTSEITVKHDETSEFYLTAERCNSRFVINYTDAFKGYMADWSATVTGAGKPIDYAKDEAEPVYVAPGKVKIEISIVKQSGTKATFSLPEVEAKARYHYNVTVDVNNGNVGDAVLTVTFDETLATETKVVDISDAVLSAAEPTVSTEGFDPAVPVEVIAGMASDKVLDINAIAPAKLGSVLLETKSETLLAQGWPASIDLMTADAAQQETLRNLGLVARGVWNNPDKMAVISFGDVLSHMKVANGDNTSVFTVTVKDALMRPADPVSLTVNVSPVRLELASAGEYFAPGEPLALKLGFNGTDVAKNVTLEYKHPRHGVWEEAKLLSVSEPVSRSMSDYTISINTPDAEGELLVRAKCGSIVSGVLTVTMAPFEVSVNDYDVYATHAYVTVKGINGEEAPALGNVKFLAKGATDADFKAVASTVSGNYADLTGLAPATEYLIKAEVDGVRCKSYKITTEEALQLANSGMENWSSKAHKRNCVEWIPEGWKTFNGITLSQVSDGGNYSYVSTSGTKKTDDKAEGSAAALIRTVGWGAGNTAAGVGGGGLSIVKHVTRGELFLGNWAETDLSQFNDASVPEYGIAFASRPSSLSFKYKFSNHNNRIGQAVITVFDKDGNSLATQSFEISDQSSYTEKVLELGWAQGMAKAAKISVIFRSGLPGVSLERKDIYQGSTLNTAEHVGSKLYIDDIKLNY